MKIEAYTLQSATDISLSGNALPFTLLPVPLKRHPFFTSGFEAMTDKSIPYSVITTKFGSVSCSRRLVNGKPVYRVDSMLSFAAAKNSHLFDDYYVRGSKTVEQCAEGEYPDDAVCTSQDDLTSFDSMWSRFMETGAEMLNLQMKLIKTEDMLKD